MKNPAGWRRLTHEIIQRARSGEVVIMESSSLTSGEVTLRRSFALDERNRVVVTVPTLGLSGSAWLAHHAKVGFPVDEAAKSLLMHPQYDEHRLVPGSTCRVALLRGDEIANDKERTLRALRAIAEQEYGAGTCARTKAELASLLRCVISDQQLREWDIWNVTVLHDPIPDSDDEPRTLSLSRDLDGRRLDAECHDLDDCWPRAIAVAVLLS